MILERTMRRLSKVLVAFMFVVMVDSEEDGASLDDNSFKGISITSSNMAKTLVDLARKSYGGRGCDIILYFEKQSEWLPSVNQLEYMEVRFHYLS